MQELTKEEIKEVVEFELLEIHKVVKKYVPQEDLEKAFFHLTNIFLTLLR